MGVRFRRTETGGGQGKGLSPADRVYLVASMVQKGRRRHDGGPQ